MLIATRFERKQAGTAFCVLCAFTTIACSPSGGQELKKRDELKEPVFRVAKESAGVAKIARVDNKRGKDHPLDPALRMAHETLELLENEIDDYTCTMIKRENINGKLHDPSQMFTKLRSRKVRNGQIVTPLSVYMKFSIPKSVAGREVIYVERTNNGKMIAHEGGFRGRFLPSVWLLPDSTLAMRGNKYPITEAGLETLIRRLIEKAERDRQHGECDVKFLKDTKINGRKCTCLQVIHPQRRPHFDFHLARVFLDDELKVPIRYASYDWPAQPGQAPPLIEEYTYVNLRLNVGLTDKDFDSRNPEYNF